jgi:hypothetical protein
MTSTLEVTAATVTIQAVVIGGKNMTVAVYDQMPRAVIYYETRSHSVRTKDWPCDAGGVSLPVQGLWRINRCPRGCAEVVAAIRGWPSDHIHVLSNCDGTPLVVVVMGLIPDAEDWEALPQAYIGVGR